MNIGCFEKWKYLNKGDFKMKNQSFFKSLCSENQYIVGNLFFMYFIQGIYVIMIGAILPMMKNEYQLGYQMGGYMISAHSVGNLITGLMSGFLPIYFGMKNSLMFLNVFTFVGFATTLVTGNPIILLISILFTGIGRGAVSNYNNLVINRLSKGHSGPLNMLHGFFAIGAFLSPFIVLFCTRKSESGWKMAVMLVIALGILSIISSPFMKLDNSRVQRGDKSNLSLGFLKNKVFLISMGIMFFYLSIEVTIMGWLVSFFIDSGIMSDHNAQILNSMLWLAILLGRFACTLIANYVPVPKMILIFCFGIALFYAILIFGESSMLMIASTAGLGLCMAGMYGTTISNTGDVFKEYPLAMGIFVTITAIGSVIMPSVVGAIAQNKGMKYGMASVLLSVIALVVFAIWNMTCQSKSKVLNNKNEELVVQKK